MGVRYSKEEGLHRFEVSDESLALIAPLPTSHASFADAKRDFISDLEFCCKQIKTIIQLAGKTKEVKNGSKT